METLLSGPALIGDASPAPGRSLRAHGTLRSASSPRVSPHGSVFIPSTLNTRHSPQNRLEHIPSVQPTALSCGRPAEILGFPPRLPLGHGVWLWAVEKPQLGERGKPWFLGVFPLRGAPVGVKRAKGKPTALHPLLPGAACRGYASRPRARGQLLPSGTRDWGDKGTGKEGFFQEEIRDKSRSPLSFWVGFVGLQRLEAGGSGGRRGPRGRGRFTHHRR